jgi:hypothetical protein
MAIGSIMKEWFYWPVAFMRLNLSFTRFPDLSAIQKLA